MLLQIFRRRLLQIVAKHTNRLNAIIEDLLMLAQLEGRGGSEGKGLKLEKVDICKVIQFGISTVRAESKKQKDSTRLDLHDSAFLAMNVSRMEQAITNLLDNAIQYSNSNDAIEVFVEDTSTTVTVCVKDQGVGIEERHLKRLFERFYRIDKARSQDAGGTGLGLAIVKHIVHLHSGSISVDSVSGKGACFLFIFRDRRSQVSAI